ncbi:MAG: ATP-binding protein [Gemmatimonadales bacterium]
MSRTTRSFPLLSQIPLFLLTTIWAVGYVLWAAFGLNLPEPWAAALTGLPLAVPLLLAAVAFHRSAQRPHLEPLFRRACHWLSVGSLVLAIANVAWAVVEISGHSADQSWVNVPFLLCYPLLTTGLFWILRAQRREVQWRPFLLDSAIVSLGLGLMVWFLALGDQWSTYQTFTEQFLGLVYPIADLALLAIVLDLLLRPVPVMNPAANNLLLAGASITALADLVYEYTHPVFDRGHPALSDVLYLVSYVALLGLAELYWRRPMLATPVPPPRELRGRASPIPVIVGCLAAIVVVLQIGDVIRGSGPLITALMITLALLLILRETFAVRENTRLQEELAERMVAARFESLVRYSSDVVLVVDTQFIVRFASPAVQRVLGLAPAEVVGQPVTDRLHPEDRRPGENFLADRLLRPAAVASVHWRLRHATGEWRSVEAVAANLLAEPTVAGLVLNLRDVTERDLLEEQLRQAQKMEAIGRLAGGVAHDFNNLLTTVLASSDLALDQLPEQSSVRADLEEIRHAATRASALTGQLLALSRKQMVEPRTLDLGRVLPETSRLLERLLGEQVRLVTQVEEGLGAVRADRGQVEQVLLNLAVNAKDAMPQGGTLTMRVSNVDLYAPLSTRFMELPAESYVKLEVEDTGEGIDEQTLPRIFEPFFTTKPQGKGTGLGLASVYGIVAQAGGAINVESTPGKGTIFQIYLPRIPHDAAAEESSALPGAENGTETILLVEDEPALKSVAQRILQAVGYTVLAAGDAEEAMQQAAGWPGTIDLLLTDVIMPGDTGPVLARRLLRRRPNVRVLYMSGYAGDELGEHGVLDTGVALLQKPFTARELAIRVREALHGARQAEGAGQGA